MSDNIPFEIQIEIIKKVSDVKSLIRFRAVSKTWKSLIESSQFISGYAARKTQPHTLLLRYIDNSDEVKYVSVNKDTFKVQQDLASNVSPFMKQFRDLKVIGYSRGLFCLYNNFERILVLWNPSIRRSVGILGVSDIFGFAVCPVTNEPTIVKISFARVHVFTLSSKRWIEIQCSMPCKSIALHDGLQVVIGSCIYRVVYKKIRLPNGYFTDQYVIASFDLITKEFKAIDLPDKITTPLTSCARFIISKLKGSVVVNVADREIKVWKIEHDCSFTELFTINRNTPDSYICDIVVFRKNGGLLFETGRFGFYGDAREAALEVYDPCPKQITNLGFSRQNYSYFISTYKETLLLLDHSDSVMYP